MNTLALSTPESDGTGWDLVIDSSGNLVVATGALAIGQDATSAVRTFRGEQWYNNTLGVPYFQRILAMRPSLQFVKQALINAINNALGAGLPVPGVASVKCFLTGPGINRQLGGQIQITTTTGEIVVAETQALLGVAPWWVSSVEP